MSDWVIVGCDPKKVRLAAVITNSNGFSFEVRKMPNEIAHCCHIAYRWMRTIVLAQRELGAKVLVVVEAPLVGRGGIRTTIVQSLVQGGLLAGAIGAGADEVKQVNQSTWKKHVVGTGRASKSEVARHIRRTWPSLYSQIRGDEDLLDSACINLYGARIVQVRARVRRSRERSRGR